MCVQVRDRREWRSCDYVRLAGVAEYGLRGHRVYTSVVGQEQVKRCLSVSLGVAAPVFINCLML